MGLNLAGLGRSQAVTRTIDHLNNQEKYKLEMEINKNKMLQHRQERERFNRERDPKNLLETVPSHARPIYEKAFEQSGFINQRNGTIKQGLFNQIHKQMQGAIPQAKIGNAKLRGITQKLGELEKIQSMRDPKQQKEALSKSKYEVKLEELDQAVVQTRKQKEATRFEVQPKMVEAENAMKLAQMKIRAQRVQSQTNRISRVNAVRQKQGQYLKAFGPPTDAYGKMVEMKDPKKKMNKLAGWIKARPLEEKNNFMPKNELDIIEQTIITNLGFPKELGTVLSLARKQGVTEKEIINALTVQFGKE